MLLGLLGMIAGVLFFVFAFDKRDIQTNLEVVAIVIPFSVFIDGILLLFILRIIKPIETLTKTSKQIADGDLSKRVEAHSKDEIGQLAEAFNVMAGKLQEQQKGLENSVTLKTSELAQKVEELEAQQAKEEAIFESIGEGLVVTGNAGNIVLMNKYAEELLDLKQQETIGKKLLDMVSLYDEEANPVSKEHNPLTAVLEQGEKITSKFILVKKNDEKINIGMTSTPVMQHDAHSHKETIIGSITTIRDITKQQQVDRMKTEFISLASHQLRTPLAAIKWFIEMLLGGDAGPLNDEQKELAQNVQDSTDRMIELVNALLNISRMEAGKITIAPTPTDLKDLVETTIKELQVKIIERKQKLTVHIDESLPKVEIDPQLIRQVYMNLLTNASKYTPEGGEISVEITRKGDEVLSEVKDNGYGIPKDQQDKLFRRFFRARNINKVETDGSGLGLYLIKAIIASSGGKIWFESEEKKGTTFWFSLPLKANTQNRQVTIDS
jgi:PAS domain S-box-containing protein